jgi:hypothetical protein
MNKAEKIFLILVPSAASAFLILSSWTIVVALSDNLIVPASRRIFNAGTGIVFSIPSISMFYNYIAGITSSIILVLAFTARKIWDPQNGISLGGLELAASLICGIILGLFLSFLKEPLGTIIAGAASGTIGGTIFISLFHIGNRKALLTMMKLGLLLSSGLGVGTFLVAGAIIGIIPGSLYGAEMFLVGQAGFLPIILLGYAKDKILIFRANADAAKDSAKARA